MTGSGETVSVVKQLQAQLRELSQATVARNDQMEEVKRRTVSDSVLVKARVANIEKNLKQNPTPVPKPIGNAINSKPVKRTGTGVENQPNSNQVNQEQPQAKKLQRDFSTPRETLDMEEEDDLDFRSKSSSTTSQLRKNSFSAIRTTYAGYFEEKQERALRPSLARSIPTYKEITESHLKGQNKVTVKLLGSSVVKARAAGASGL